MNRIKIIAIFVLFSIFEKNIAQEYKDFIFSKEINYELTPSQKESEEAVLKYFYSTQYTVSDDEDGQYIFAHTARWINSDKAIKENNKVYLAASENTNYLFQKARVIKSNGEIVELEKGDIKEGVYEENEQKYYYFALEGLEKGSIIETATYRKQRPNYYGSLINLQEDVIRYDQQFELICPDYLEFAFKSINNAPVVKEDTAASEWNRWMISIDSVAAVLRQPTMFDNVVKQGVLYKINRNLAKNTGDLTSYGNASRNVYANLYPEYSKSELKQISKIGKELNLKNMEGDLKKIKGIENYLKSNFQVVESPNPDLAKIDFIVEQKAANSTGITRLHLALLDIAEVKNEIVLTTDRTEIRFDPKFEAYLFLDNYLIYFPKENIFLAPDEKYLRAPIVPSEWMHNNGLFIKTVEVGDVVMPIGEVKFIDALPYSMSSDDIEVNIDFAEDIAQPNIKFQKTSSGYTAQFFQPYFHLMDEEAIKNAKKAMVKMVNEEMEADEVELENTGVNDFGSKPFIYRFETKEHSFIERAGEDYLFKLGLLIGPQMEMYQEKKRQFDVESENSRRYTRLIKFNVPAGYEIKNIDDLKISYKFGESEDINLLFNSDYIVEGNDVTVTSEEYYTEIIYPKERFEEYQKVINAAADFNKIVLVLQKK
ncbi:MAG: hypothetical protein ACI9DK_001733 [Vicingaceae bacterium]|jgi:hypothetical protein